MIFIVALDPASIEWAGTQGELGSDHLTGVLQCLLQNCFIAETQTWRVGAELKAAVKTLSEGGSRKKVSAILETLASRNRFFPVIDDGTFEYDVPLGNILVSQANHSELDAIVTESEISTPGSVEVFKLGQFNQSNFARERSRRTSSVTFAPGSLDADELLRSQFRKLLTVGDEVVMIDYIIGRDFGGNFADSLKHWCIFLDGLNKKLKWTIHTEPAQCHSIRAFIQSKIAPDDITINIVGHNSAPLPHERYLRCAGMCIDIGRGIDLFDRNGRIRDVRLGLGDDPQFLREYPHLT